MANERLSAKAVSNALRKNAPNALLSDGGGLYLKVEGDYRQWFFRYTSPTTGKRRELGIGRGGTNGVSLEAARKRAATCRDQIANRLDPLDLKHAADDAKRARLAADAGEKRRATLTLARVARDYHERVIESNRTPKHSAQWIATLEQHVFPKLGDKPIDEVTGVDLRDLLLPLQNEIPETASRIRQRLDAIFDHAVFEGLVAATPAGAPLRKKLREAADKRDRGHFRALAYVEVAAFVAALRKVEGVAARALEFLLLTAARTGEVIGATWAEVDMRGKVWTVPAERMKAGQEHRVYVPGRAVEILRDQHKRRASYCFASPTGKDRPLSNMAFLELLKHLRHDANAPAYSDLTTVHGLRATFSTWAYEVAQRAVPQIARQDVIEACLAHNEANAVKRAYSRAQFDDDRRELLRMWADFCTTEPSGSSAT